jgi:NAD(P)-dependent dehydrogenase (short-subunit alcohol dehydrogenase family)
MELGLRDKAVLITGASRGIGRAIALAFAAEGARVAICARGKERLDSVAAEIRARGAECAAFTADLFESADCQRVVDDTARAFGRLDILVNNASTSVDKTPKTLTDATDKQLMERFMGKTMGAIRCARAAIPHMRRAGGGHIVCIGGTAARTVFRGSDLGAGDSGVAQGLGNAALANFTKFLSEEVARDRILVNIVHPHSVRTDRHPERVARRAKASNRSEAEAEADMAAQVPIGRLIEPGDIAPLVLLLSSPLSSAITGQAIAVDGGTTRMISY